jgi:hypothetical protein
MRLAAFLILLLSLVAVTGCERISRMTGAPSRTTLPECYPAGTEKGQKVAVCYGGATTSMEALAAAAAELCKEPGSTVEFVTEDLHLNECPLLKKRRAVFACHEPR